MKLSADLAKRAGLFIGKPVKKEIELDIDGEKGKATFWVKRLGYSTVAADLEALTKDRDHVAMRLAASIVNEKEVPIFTYDEVLALNEEMTVKLWGAFTEVNYPQKKT